ncbi:NAD(P)-binding protein [Thozetella sp. PMI_491]|nr:NAD(P)-binding protein [Thozetella sp. PMI_491]
MPKLLTVFGATGKQGGSVIKSVLNDPELSQEYNVRIVTRNIDSEKSKQLWEKVEVVHGDMTNRASIEAALTDTNTVFVMTAPTWGPNGLEGDDGVAEMIADVAVEKGVEYIIFSTLPSATEISGGKYTTVTLFDAKAKAEKHIRGLPIKSAFFSGGFFMENFLSKGFFLSPKQTSDGTWIISCHITAKTLLPYINSSEDTGKFLGAILAEPEKFEGKTLTGAVGLYSMEAVAAIMSKATGKTITYRKVSLESFKTTVPYASDMWGDCLKFMEEFNYYGPNTNGLITWATENARGRLTTLEEFFDEHREQLI